MHVKGIRAMALAANSPPLVGVYAFVPYWAMMTEETPEAVAQVGPCIVAIGASGAKGLGDIGRVLGGFPAGLNAVVMVVLHRPSNQVSHLRAVLSRRTPLPVLVASQDVPLREGHCYIGEPGAHLEMAARSLGHLITADVQHRNRTIDLLFTSVARHAGARFIGIVLSGSLDDGSRGLAAIHAAGGITMVLTPGGTSFDGMPENAIAYDGPIDVIGDPERIAAEIVSRAGRRSDAASDTLARATT